MLALEALEGFSEELAQPQVHTALTLLYPEGKLVKARDSWSSHDSASFLVSLTLSPQGPNPDHTTEQGYGKAFFLHYKYSFFPAPQILFVNNNNSTNKTKAMHFNSFQSWPGPLLYDSRGKAGLSSMKL